jgi:hypothetical protein
VKIPTTLAALILVVAFTPSVVNGQTTAESPTLNRFSIEFGGGPLLQSGGHTVSAAVGFSPISRLDLLMNVERDHLPYQRDTFTDGYSITRGGTLTTVSGEVRASLFPPHRVSPYILAGMGGGLSRPTVNEAFPDFVENKLRVVYFGGGLRVPLRGGLVLFGDARAMMALEGNDGILGVWPVRAGITWRF